MGMITIDEKVFNELIFKLEMFAGKVEALCERLGKQELRKWYDNQDVCRILHISPRTLQTLRGNGMLPYTQVNRKIFYRPEDVDALVLRSGLTDKKG
jgi:hypothetical protein